MRKIYGVIGANYGDEGKGRFVDFIANRNPGSIVVRHNSGGQAGHTVQVGEKRHVFHHFGSGTLRGIPTFLTHNFVVNPMIFNDEWRQLAEIGVTPMVYMDSRCRMSTFLDMILNQLTEHSRGEKAHGSCGVGFGDTIQRHIYDNVKLDVSARRPDLSEHQLMRYFMNQVEERELLKNPSTPPLSRFLNAASAGNVSWGKYWAEYRFMMDRVRIIPNPEEFLRSRDTIIFEGAQGLMLHEDHEYAPHVTWCRTGGEDMAAVLREAYIEDELHLLYATRSYVTRHGNGPFPEFDPSVEDRVPADPTNMPNAWQGKLRYGKLNFQQLMGRIGFDMIKVETMHPNTTWSIGVSCADQHPLDEDFAMVAQLVGNGPDSSDTTVDESWLDQEQRN